MERGIRLTDIFDGTSHTILAGEKHVRMDQFGVGWLDCSLYNGDYFTCSTRGAGPSLPLARSPHDWSVAFGSYHPGFCQFVFGDGHVYNLSITVDPQTLGLLAHRNDGMHVPDF